MISAISQTQRVIVSFHSESLQKRFSENAGTHGIYATNLTTAVIPSNDCWARDHGPISILEDDQCRLLDFQFDGWNKKYPFELDNRITGELHRLDHFGHTEPESISCVLEGGSIETNGQGLIATTSHCLIKQNRNPGFCKRDYESMFAQWFGCSETLWIDDVCLTGDDTDGHIDTLLRFCPDDTILYQFTDDQSHVDYQALNHLHVQLKDWNASKGNSFSLVPVSAPQPVYSAENTVLPASYVNFTICNELVLAPVYNDKNDQLALHLLQEKFPQRTIIAIPALALIQQCGSVHCTSMQLPAGVIH